MQFLESWLFPVMWIAYLGYWNWMSRSVKETERVEGSLSRLLRILCFLLAVWLLAAGRVPVRSLNIRFLPDAAWVFWLGAVVCAAGLLFSVWARRHLGSNWSQAVTVKHGHELIQSGPYAFVRHPIYAGLLTGFLGSAIARGEWRGLLAVAIVFAALWHKLKLEEKWMREQFGEQYAAYSRKVKALVPWVA